jgi:hypothetical protein
LFPECPWWNWEKLGKSPNLYSAILGYFYVDESNYSYMGGIHVQMEIIVFIELNYRSLMVDEEIIKQIGKKTQIRLINLWRI